LKLAGERGNYSIYIAKV